MVKTSEGIYNKKYMICYIDDYLIIIRQPKELLNRLNKYFPLKSPSVGPSKLFLAANLLSQMTLPNGIEASAMWSSQYLHEELKHVEKEMVHKGLKFKR